MRQVKIYKSFERFWHWMQAVLIGFLILTGFEIHGSYEFLGFRNAVHYHNAASYAFIGLIVFAIFWHFATGEWKQYIPTFSNLKAQMFYYLSGIFHHAEHPHRKTELSKLNPIQRLVYLGLKLLVIPVMVTTGLLAMFYRYPHAGEVNALPIGGLTMILVIHTLGAFSLVAFLIVHLYLITTGTTVASNLKAMITGYEDLEEEDEEVEELLQPLAARTRETRRGEVPSKVAAVLSQELTAQQEG
ncbi:cytochrome b/b6 domain-containing protein [bacterium]|nr:cytochrome b/b6 domain-containing protein [bacterium]